jgi:hypothetical protein
MKRSRHHSHCWKHCLMSSLEMPLRAASDSCWTSAIPAKRLPLGEKHNSGCVPPPTHPTSFLVTFFVPTDEAGFESFVDTAAVQQESLTVLDGISVWTIYTIFPAFGAVLGSLHPVTKEVFWRGLHFWTCTNTLYTFFLTIPEMFVPLPLPHPTPVLARIHTIQLALIKTLLFYCYCHL